MARTETPYTLALRAARELLEGNGIDPDSVELLIHCGTQGATAFTTAPTRADSSASHRTTARFRYPQPAPRPGGGNGPPHHLVGERVGIPVLAGPHGAGRARALTLGAMLDTAYTVWADCPRWRRRGIARPALTDLETYRLFEDAVEETGDEKLAAITRSLSHFVPQLALPKVFDTRRMDGVVGRPPPDPTRFWGAMIRHLVHSRWAAEARRAA